MTIWEAHRDLSLSIGDPVMVNIAGAPVSIDDGVRFSRQLRDNFLYRAMLEIVSQGLKITAGIPRVDASIFLNRLFPLLSINESQNLNPDQVTTFNYMTIYTLNALQRDSVFVYSVSAQHQAVYYPIPVKHGSQIDSLLNTRNIQRPDSFCTISNGRIMIYDSLGELLSGDWINIKYLAVPENPALYSDAAQTTTYQPLRNINIDDSFLPKMFSLATLYSLSADQDIVNTDRYLPMELGLGGMGSIGNNERERER